eukprot:gene6221-8573_t
MEKQVENPFVTKFSVKHAFGSHVTPLDSLQSYAAASGKELVDRLLYKVGRQVCIFDAETNSQTYFENRAKNVTDVLHFCISSNSRYISMCEIIRYEKASEASSHIAIYSMTTMNKLMTLSNNTSSRPFICSTFCGDPKMLAALTDEPDRHIVIWLWEKAKIFKTVALTINPTIIRSSPSSSLMLTISGNACLKCWFVGSDGSLKTTGFLPNSKEMNEKFIDHVWLQSNLGLHKMVALVDPDAGANSETSAAVMTRGGRKQFIYIFEGQDVVVPNSANSAAAAGIAPITMELKQTVALKLEFGAKMEKIVPSLKAFMLVGTMGLVCQYERTDEKNDPYIESRRISLGDIHLVGGTVYPSEEKMVLLAKSGRILCMPLDVSIDQLRANNDNSSATGRSNSIDDEISVSSVRKPSDNGGISDLTMGGFHTAPILSSDTSYERTLLMTISGDNSARIWNYSTLKCELVHYFRNDEPLATAFHSSGFQVLVSFKDRIRMYNVLMDKLKPYREAVLKNCKCLKFSHGSQYFAAASAVNVSVYETKSFQQLMTFQGHMMTVVRICWAVGDQVLFSAGSDGNVYGWPVSKDGRLDVVAASARSSQIIDMIVDSSSTVFQVIPKDQGDSNADESTTSARNTSRSTTSKQNSIANQNNNSNNNSSITNTKSINRTNLIISSMDGSIKMPTWSMDSLKTSGGASTAASRLNANNEVQVIAGDSSITMTALCLSKDRTKFYAGTSIGSIRIYDWPCEDSRVNANNLALTLPGTANNNGPIVPSYVELFSHSGAVVALKLSPLENTLISTGADGCVFIHNISDESNKPETAFDPFEANSDTIVMNSEVLMMSTEDIEDHVNEVVELQKILSETRAKNEFQSRKLESDHTEAMKKINEQHELFVSKEKENFDKQRVAFDKRIRELMSGIEQKESDHVKIITEIENKYEHKLADQLERYDLLSEKMTLLKQKCEGLLEAEKNNFHKQLNELKEEARNREKKIKIELRRAIDDKQSNESAFKEIINQQEDEYEDELKQLIGAAESELVSERETIMKLRTLVQTKNTKLDQLKKKMVELSTASKARMILLNQERQEKQKLLDTIEHYKKNLIEREDALAEKEKIVLELRSTTRTLENFRFVLDHRLQQLSSERGPITSHIEGLEKHISTMYEELVEEFNMKKAMSESSVLKDQKIQWITQDLNKLRQGVRERDQLITQFKRELGNVVTSSVVGKELDEAIKILYKKFVKGEVSSEFTAVRLNDQAVSQVHELLDDDDNTVLSQDSVGKGKVMTAAGIAANTAPSKQFLRDVEEALVETAKEADRQKKFVERQSNQLQHRLDVVKEEAHVAAKRKLHENSKLLYECNELRKEITMLHRKLEIKKNELDISHRKIEILTSQLSNTHQYTNSRSRHTSFAPMGTLDGFANPNNNNAQANRSSAMSVPSKPYDDETLGSRPDPEPIQPPLNDTSEKAGQGKLIQKARLELSKSAPLLSLQANNSTGAFLYDKNENKMESVEQKGPPSRGLGNKSSRNSAPQLDLMVSNANNANVKANKKGNADLKSQSIKKGNERVLPTVTELQTEKLHREIDSLAQQLDDSIREREIQRIELSRLRKQMMTLSGSSGVGGTIGIIPSATNNSLMLPSILSNGGINNYPGYGLDGTGPQAGSRINLTNADIYGIPSEEDKRALQLGPVKNNNSSSAGRSARSASPKQHSMSSQRKSPSEKVGIKKSGKGKSESSNMNPSELSLKEDHDSNALNKDLNDLSLYSNAKSIPTD